MQDGFFSHLQILSYLLVLHDVLPNLTDHRFGQKRKKKKAKFERNACAQYNFFYPSLSWCWACSDSLAGTQFARLGQSCRRVKVQTDGLCHLTLILLMMIRKNPPPKIPTDWNAHLDEKSHCRWFYLLSLFVAIEVSSRKNCTALMKFPWQQNKRQENNCGPVLDKINEQDLTVNPHQCDDSTFDISPENGFDMFLLLCKSYGVQCNENQVINQIPQKK